MFVLLLILFTIKSYAQIDIFEVKKNAQTMIIYDDNLFRQKSFTS